MGTKEGLGIRIMGQASADEIATEWSARRMTIRHAITELIIAIGDDPQREGLRDTPERVARFWQEFMLHDAGNADVTFDEVTSDDLIAVGGMRLWSMCEHHLLPFSIEVAVGYVPRGDVIGLSKIARIAQRHAHRLQVQERIALGIADELSDVLTRASSDHKKHEDVAVVIRGEHSCMTMRGVRTEGTMHASVMRGRFRTVDSLRAEFLALVK